MTLKELHSVLGEAGITVFHYEASLENLPYISFIETGTSYNYSSGRAWREITNVIVDHLTQEEFGGESLELLKKALLKNKVNFTTSTIYYEDLKVIHTIFTFSIVRDMEV